MKKVLIILVGVLVLMAGSFAAGKYTQPAKVVTKVEYREKEVVKVVTVKDQKSDTHTDQTTTTTKRPDGTVITTTHTTKDNETHTDTNTQSVDTKTVTEKESKVVVNAKPDWHFSAKLGLDWGLLYNQRQLGKDDLIYGLEAERRIVGPVWLGVWGMSNKTGGLSLSLQF